MPDVLLCLKREVAARLEAEAIAERGLRDLFQRQQEISLLESIAVAANEAEGVYEAMQRALGAMCSYANWPLGHLWLIAERHGERHFDSTSVWHDSVPRQGAGPVRELCALTEASEFALGAGLPGRVVASSAPVSVDVGSATLDELLRIEEIVCAGFATLLEFFSVERKAPSESMLRLMAQIGTQLGRVIERRRAQDKLVHDALHDPLTQLGNRKLFLERLQHLDLDRFKSINDGLGHQSGDQLIIGTAARLSSCLRQTDLVARDLALAERIMGALAEPFEVAGQRVFVTASVGIALSASGYADVEGILRDADIAMYHAKQTGRSASCSRSTSRSWRHPVHGLVPPNEFVPVAEEIGLIEPIGSWVLEQACRQLRDWQQSHDMRLDMSVNVSAVQFNEGALVEVVRRLPIDTLKIDRSFVS